MTVYIAYDRPYLTTLSDFIATAGGAFENTLSLYGNNTALATVYMENTNPVAGGNSKTYTISFWANRLAVPSTADGSRIPILTGAEDVLIETGNVISVKITRGTSADTNDYLAINEVDLDTFGTNLSVTGQISITEGEWDHFLVQVDTTQATSTDRIKLFQNGVQLTTFTTDKVLPSLNYETMLGSSLQAVTYGFIDPLSAIVGEWLVDEVAYTDGTIYNSGSFDSGGPIDLSGLTFGSNGVWLRFETGDTATIGQDYSPQGNDFVGVGYTSTYFSTDVPP